MDSKALKAQMVLAGINAAELAQMLDISTVAIYRKINGKSEFTQSELSKIAQIFKLDAQQIQDIFFAKEVS